jgi:hypothetical protein
MKRVKEDNLQVRGAIVSQQTAPEILVHFLFHLLLIVLLVTLFLIRVREGSRERGGDRRGGEVRESFFVRKRD